MRSQQDDLVKNYYNKSLNELKQSNQLQFIKQLSQIINSEYYKQMNYIRLNSLSLNFKSYQRFSNLKKRLSHLRSSTHNNLKQLYQDLQAFEKTLTYNEWLKFDKLTEQIDKKYRRIRSQQQEEFNFTLNNTFTSEYFYQKDTAYAYYINPIVNRQIQPQIKKVTLQQLNKETSKYLNFDMEFYHKTILPTPSNYKNLVQKINTRFTNVEEVICRHVFQGYQDFSTFQENLFYKKETKYKGDFKFRLVQNSNNLFEEASPIFKNISMLNQCRSKAQLACELILTKHWKQLSEKALADYMFSISMRGKQLHQISSNIMQISQKMPNHTFQFLLYMVVSGCQNQTILQKVKQLRANSQEFNQFQCWMHKLLAIYIQKSKNISLDWNKIKEKGDTYYPAESDMYQTFIHFLKQKRYEFTQMPDQTNYITPNRLVQIQDKKFICLTNLFYNQDSKPNGLFRLVSLYFSQFGQKIKFMNPCETLFKETLRQKQQYFLSKMKGLKKPNYKKPSKFDFYTMPQQRQKQAN